MFHFCRRFKLFISYVLIFSHLQSSTALATHNFLVLEVEEREASSLSLKVGHHILEQDGVEQKRDIGRYHLSFEDLPVYSSWQGNFLFQGLSTKEACTLRLGYEQTEINFVVYQDGKIIVRNMQSPDGGIKLNSFGQVITDLGDVQSLFVIGKSFTQEGNIKIGQDLYLETQRGSVNAQDSELYVGREIKVKGSFQNQGIIKGGSEGCLRWVLHGQYFQNDGTISSQGDLRFTGGGIWRNCGVLHSPETLSVHLSSGFFHVGEEALIRSKKFDFSCHHFQLLGKTSIAETMEGTIRGRLTYATPPQGENDPWQFSSLSAGKSVALTLSHLSYLTSLVTEGSLHLNIMQEGYRRDFGLPSFMKIGGDFTVTPVHSLVLGQAGGAASKVFAKGNVVLNGQRIDIQNGGIAAGGDIILNGGSQGISVGSVKVTRTINRRDLSPAMFDISLSYPRTIDKRLSRSTKFWINHMGLGGGGNLLYGEYPEETYSFNGSYLSAQKSLILTSQDHITSHGAHLSAKAPISIQAATLFNNESGVVQAEQDIRIRTPRFFNQRKHGTDKGYRISPSTFYVDYLWSSSQKALISAGQNLIFEGMEEGLNFGSDITHGGSITGHEKIQHVQSGNYVKVDMPRFFLDAYVSACYWGHVHFNKYKRPYAQYTPIFNDINFCRAYVPVEVNTPGGVGAVQSFFRSLNELVRTREIDRWPEDLYVPYSPTMLHESWDPLPTLSGDQATFSGTHDYGLQSVIFQHRALDFNFKDVTVGRFLPPTMPRYTPFHHRQDLIDYMPVSQLQIEAPQDSLAMIVPPAVLRNAEEEKKFLSPVVISRNNLSTNSSYKRLYHPEFEMDAVQKALLKNLNRPFLDFSGEATREAVYNHLMMNTQVVHRALEGRSTPEDMKRFSAISDAPSNQLIIPTSSGESRTILFDEPLLLYYHVDMNGETFLGATILSPPSWEEKTKPVRSLAGGVFSDIGFYKGQNLLVYGELSAQLSKNEVQNTEVMGKIEYRALPPLPRRFFHHALLPSSPFTREQQLIQAKLPTDLALYPSSTTSGAYALTQQGKYTGVMGEFHGGKVTVHPGALLKEDSAWFTNPHTLNRGRMEIAHLTVADSARMEIETAQRHWTETHQRIWEKTNWLGKSKTRILLYTVARQESYPRELSGTLRTNLLVGAPEIDVSSFFAERQSRLKPYVHTFINQGGLLDIGEGGLYLHVSDLFSTAGNRETQLVPYSTEVDTLFSSHSEQGVLCQETLDPAQIPSQGPVHILSDQKLSVEGTRVSSTGKGRKGLIQLFAQKELAFPGTILRIEDAPRLRQKGMVIQRVSGSHGEGVASQLSASQVFLKSGENVTGVQPHIVDGGLALETQEMALSLVLPEEENSLSPKNLVEKSLQRIQSQSLSLALSLSLSPQDTRKTLARLQPLEVFQRSLPRHRYVEIIDAVIPAEVTMVVSLAVSLTVGVLLPGAGLLLTSAISGLASQTAVSLLAHSGNIGKALQELGTREFRKSLAFSVATAVLTHEIGTRLKLPAKPHGFEQHLTQSAVRAGVKAGLEMALYQRDPQEALIYALKSTAANTVGGLASQELGDMYKGGAGNLDYLTHKLLHIGNGAVSGMILGGVKGAAPGAIGAGVSEIVATGLYDLMETPGMGNIELCAGIGKISAVTVAALTDQDMDIALTTASNAVDYNFSATAEKNLKKSSQGEEGGYDTDDEAEKTTYGKIHKKAWEEAEQGFEKGLEIIGLGGEGEPGYFASLSQGASSYAEQRIAKVERLSGRLLTLQEKAILTESYREHYEEDHTALRFVQGTSALVSVPFEVIEKSLRYSGIVHKGTARATRQALEDLTVISGIGALAKGGMKSLARNFKNMPKSSIGAKPPKFNILYPQMPEPTFTLFKGMEVVEVQPNIYKIVSNNTPYSSSALDIRTALFGGDQGGMKLITRKDGTIKGVTHTQDHHIIPQSLRKHPLWEKAGMDVDQRVNRMLLPDKTGAKLTTTERQVHVGKHFKSVKEELEREMYKILENGERLGYTQQHYAEKLSNLIRQERELLHSGERALNNVTRNSLKK